MDVLHDIHFQELSRAFTAFTWFSPTPKQWENVRHWGDSHFETSKSVHRRKGVYEEMGGLSETEQLCLTGKCCFKVCYISSQEYMK